MAEYPISIPVDHYFGNDDKKLREFTRNVQLARRIEEYINSRMSGNINDKYYYNIVASDLGVSTSMVGSLLMLIGGGNHGITVENPTKQNS